MIQLARWQAGKGLYFNLNRTSYHIPSGCLNNIAEKNIFFFFSSCRWEKKTIKRVKDERSNTEGREIEIERLQRRAIKKTKAKATGIEPFFTSGLSVLWPILRWVNTRIFRENSHFSGEKNPRSFSGEGCIPNKWKEITIDRILELDLSWS